MTAKSVQFSNNGFKYILNANLSLRPSTTELIWGAFKIKQNTNIWENSLTSQYPSPCRSWELCEIKFWRAQLKKQS